MKTIKIIILSVLFLFCLNPFARAEETPGWAERSFLILVTTKDYNTALQVAQTAANELKLPLDLRGLSPYPDSKARKPELSFSKSECEDNGWDEPCYVPRARFFDDKKLYVSVELTNGYKSLTPGYFFVTAGVVDPGDLALKDLLAKAKAQFKDAYIKTGEVFVGCLH